MFNNRLKMQHKNGRVYGKAVFPSPEGDILVATKETVIGSNVQSAIDKVTAQITAAAEFFPLNALIGEDSFIKAVRLYGTLKKGTPQQKQAAKTEIATILENARQHNDSTSQDIEYALARIARAEKDHNTNVSGDIMFDAFGFSPANLRKNLDKLAEKNPSIKNAKVLFMMLRSGNKEKIALAVKRIREIYQDLMNDNVSGNGTNERVTLIGLNQYMRAENCSLAKTKLFGRDDVTLGFSFKKLTKKIAKTAMKPVSLTAKTAMKPASFAAKLKPIKATLRVAKKAAPYAALATFGPAALISKDVRKSVGLQKSKKAPTKPLANSASTKLMAQASLKQPAAIAKVKAINEMAKAGNPSAQSALSNLQDADEQNRSFAEEFDEPGDEQYEEAYENAPEESYDEPEEESYDESEEEYDEGLTDSTEDIEGDDMVGWKFSLKPGKKFKSAMSVVKPLAKTLTSLAAKAADSFVPGSGAALQAALPALIDQIPSDRQKDLTMARLAKGVEMVKAASEMDPAALASIDNIKKLAAQGVPDAVTTLDALKVAKAAQKISEGTAASVLQDRQAGYVESAMKNKGLAVTKNNGGDIVNVRIVEWGPQK